MKILQIHNFYRTPGGECSVVEAEKKLLETHGQTVLQFTLNSNEIDVYSLIRKSLSFLQIPYNFQIRRSLSSFIERNEPDVAHVHNVFPLLSPAVYPTLKRHFLPVVQTIHNFRFLCPNGKFYVQGKICEDCLYHGFLPAVRKKCMHNSRIISLLYASAIDLAWRSRNLPHNIDLYIALNQFVSEKIVAGGVPMDKVRICGNFVEDFASSLMTKKKYLLYLGRLSPEKGLWTLLNALKKLEGVNLKIAGSGPIESELKEFVREHPGMNVEFYGFVKGSEKELLIKEALCTIVPSEWYENSPISVLESLALGTPVIASRIGGLPEMVVHGRSGLLFTPGDADELAKAITEVVRSDTKAQKMAEETINFAKSSYGPEIHYRKLMDVYGEAVTRG